MVKRNHEFSSVFLEYLCICDWENKGRLPSLLEISKEIGVSVPTLREQMEVARALGLIEAKPRMGIKRLSYSFRPAVLQSLFFAISMNPERFEEFSNLRSHIEMSYFIQAVEILEAVDIDQLKFLVKMAKNKLNQDPIIIPHSEHRELHLTIYRRLDNIFVTGLLEAYWDAYERTGLDIYTDIQYLNQVWDYHQRMVDAITENKIDQAHKLLVEHMALLYKRPQPLTTPQRFE